MNKKLIPITIGISLLLLFGLQPTSAQDKKTSTIKLTITEDDKITTDTTFELAEGQDPEMIKKIVSHLAGGEKHPEHRMSDINIDSIREANPDAKMLVIKNKNGEVTVEKVDNEHEMHLKDTDHGEHQEMVFISSKDGGETVHVHKSKSGQNIMMIMEEEGEVLKDHRVIIVTDSDNEGTEKEIEVIVDGNDDHVWIEKGDEEDVKVIKKKVVVKIEEDDEAEEPKKVKEKKKKLP